MKSISCDACGEYITNSIRYAVIVDRFIGLVPSDNNLQGHYDMFDLCGSCYKHFTRIVLGRKEDAEEKKDCRDATGPEYGF